MSTHELEKKELEENFEKLRLSLQVTVVLALVSGEGQCHQRCPHTVIQHLCPGSSAKHWRVEENETRPTLKQFIVTQMVTAHRRRWCALAPNVRHGQRAPQAFLEITPCLQWSEESQSCVWGKGRTWGKNIPGRENGGRRAVKGRGHRTCLGITTGT